MSTEPFTTQNAGGAADSEQGVLLALLLMVLLGVAAIFLVS